MRTFVPDDLRLIKGSPRRRRVYLDTLAARRDPDYADGAQGVRLGAGPTQHTASHYSRERR